jgi:hypothetical protein
MHKLIVDSPRGHEESDFQTLLEAQAHFDSLELSGYFGSIGEYTYSIIEVIPVKEDVSPRQLRLALLSAGITEAMIDGAIALLESPTKEQAQIAWKYSLSYKRSESAVAVIGTLAGLTSDQLDGLWDLARTL